MEYAFHVYNKFAADGATMSLQRLLDGAYYRKKNKRRGDGSRSSQFSPSETREGSRCDRTLNACAGTPFGATEPPVATPYDAHARVEPPDDYISEPSDDPTSGRSAPNPPIVVCVGSDLAIGDSLGPIVGSMLRYKTQGLNAFIYGTLSAPITAKEIASLRRFLRETHRGRQVLAIDAAVGDKGDIGLIKLSDAPLLPGAGANKNLGALGDASIMAVVAEKSLGNYGLLNTTRLNLVYSMSEIISDAVATLLWERCSAKNAPRRYENFSTQR